MRDPQAEITSARDWAEELQRRIARDPEAPLADHRRAELASLRRVLGWSDPRGPEDVR